LDLADRDGYRRCRRAGTNLVTMNPTPGNLRCDHVTRRSDRFILTEERVLRASASEGLTPSPRGLSAYYRNGVSHPAMAQAVSAAT